MFSVRKHSPRAFTLVEMLVVMAIIGILVALLLPAVMSAMAAAQRARNGVDITQLMQAIEMYKSEKGSYPPSFGEGANSNTYYADQLSGGTYRNTLLYRHIVTAYPKCDNDDIEHMFEDVADKLDQASALVFWLSQTSEDVRNPFTRQTQLRKFMDFDSRRLIVVSNLDAEPAHNFPGMPIYHFKAPYSKETPYIYIDSASYGSFANVASTNGAQGATPSAGTATFDNTGRNGRVSLVRPVVSNKGGWVNPQTFQLFCAGLDGRYSSAAALDKFQVFPIAHYGTGGTNTAAFPYDDFIDDRDNQTNFTEGKRIEDFIP